VPLPTLRLVINAAIPKRGAVFDRDAAVSIARLAVNFERLRMIGHIPQIPLNAALCNPTRLSPAQPCIGVRIAAVAVKPFASAAMLKAFEHVGFGCQSFG
jgi:hypothetical protein